MKKNRSVQALLYAQPIDMGGMPVRQAFPTQRVEQVDPFLLLHHALVKVPAHLEPRHAGVGPHPHRGFSPVTFIFKGGVHHRDSRGNNSVIYAGGTQWMHAGMGVIHSERPPQDIHELGGEQELIQLWVNSPAAHKMDEPHYTPLRAEDTPVFHSEDGKVSAYLQSGMLFGLKGPIPTFTELNSATLYFKEGGTINIPLPESHHAFIYLLDGALQVEGYGQAEGYHAVVFENDGEGISLRAEKDTRVLLMSGEPIGEKVTSHGPFVMNTQTEVMEAFRDYQMGRMGVLIEE